MQKTFLEQNPFYILAVLPSDKRVTIVSKAEEMSFCSDSDMCTEAQLVLINPNKRLSVELDWFIEADCSRIDEVTSCLNNNKPIIIDNLNELSKLNAMIYNSCISNESDSFSIWMEILDIDKCFGALNLENLKKIINDCRRIAQMAEVTDNDLLIEVGKKRERIRGIISERLHMLNDSDYIKLVTLLAEKYIADEDYNDSGVISDIIDQYEIWSKSIIESKIDEIQESINIIKIAVDSDGMRCLVSNLIDLIKKLDIYLQPIQVSKAAKGIQDKISRDVAVSIRNIAVYLHNEKSETELSLQIIETVKKYFAELYDVIEEATKDEEILRNIVDEKEKQAKYELDKKRNKQADKEYLVDIFANRFVIPSFCTCCMKSTSSKETVKYSVTTQHGTMKRTRSISVDMPICDECLKHRETCNLILILICLISIVIGSIPSLIMIANGVESLFPLGIGACVAAAIYFTISALWKLPSLSSEHAARGKSVKVFSLFGDNRSLENKHRIADITFTFYNWEYAQLFYKSNVSIASQVQEKSKINTAKRCSMLRTNEHLLVNMFRMLGVLLLLVLIIGANL